MKNYLNSIILNNFKSFKKERIDLVPLTLLTGWNNSGKSSIIQAIRIFYLWILGKDPTLPDHGSLEKLKNIYSRKDEGLKITCSFGEKSNITMKVSFHESGQITIKPPKQSIKKLPIINFIAADRLGPSVKLPIHTGVEKLYHVGEHGEFVIDFLDLNENSIVPEKLQHPKSEGKTLLFNVRAWLEEISPDIDLKHTRDEKRDISYITIHEFRPTNAGFGISYTLPVIVILLGMASKWQDQDDENKKKENGSLILLENPEAHLHPKAQTSMGKLIAKTVEAGVQVIVETHSDHLLDGIRIAVKEKILSCEKVKLYYCKLDKERNTELETTKITQDGKIDFWPEGFFDQTMKNRAILSKK